MANQLFLYDQLVADRALVVGKSEVLAAALQRDEGDALALQNELKIVISKELFLSACLSLYDWIELGHKRSNELDGKMLVHYSDVLSLSDSVQSYLNQDRLMEVCLLQNPLYLGEPAIFFLYRGNHGAIACVHGMRYQTRTTFAAGEPSRGLAENLIRSVTIIPIRVGLYDCVIHTIPIFRPGRDQLLQDDISSKVRRFLRKYCPVRDGFLIWDELDLSSVAPLAKKGWWEMV